MNRQQLEATVIAAIDQLRNGGALEDDRMELKREWPTNVKARQLAGAANRARGEYVIYVIGVDEKTGEVLPIGGVDPASWWAQLSAQFDEVVPELVHHINVYVAPGEVVAALLFRTDRAPYLVKVANGSAEREVPIRVGTRTRSAFRHELMRLLVPAAAVPPVILLDASLGGQWTAHREAENLRPAVAEAAHLYGSATLFVEHVGPVGIFMPAHEMHSAVTSGEWKIPLETILWTGKDPDIPQSFGVTLRGDGVAVTGPGRFTVRFSAALGGDQRSALTAVERWNLDIRIGVTAAPGAVTVGAALERSGRVRAGKGDNYEPLPSWRYAPG